MKEFIKLSFKSIEPMYFVIYYFLGFIIMSLLYTWQLEFLDINIPLPLFIISYIFYPFSKYMWDIQWRENFGNGDYSNTNFTVDLCGVWIFGIFYIILNIAFKLFIIAVKLIIPFILAIPLGVAQCFTCYFRREIYEEENNCY